MKYERPVPTADGNTILPIASQPVRSMADILSPDLVLAADVIDKAPRNRGLFRDLVAGGTTTLLALFLSDVDGVAIGAVVTVVATSRLVQKLN